MKLDCLSAEGRILLACATRGPDPDAIRGLLHAHLDWAALVARAVRHGLAPLLHVSLGAMRSETPGAPPGATLSQLRVIYERQAGRHARRVAALDEIGMALARCEVPVVVLKGAALASIVYEDPAFRTMGDVDLLVRRSQLGEANRILRELRYTPNESWRSEAWYRTHHHHLAPLDAPDGSVIVELHHSIVGVGGRARVPIDELWERARPAHIGAGTFRVLAPTDLLLHLCLHLARDNTFFDGKLRDLRDIALTVRRYGSGIEWDALVERARAWQVARYVYWALWLAREMVDASIPSGMLGRLAGNQRDSLSDRLIQRILPLSMLHPEPRIFAVPYVPIAATILLLVGAEGRGGFGRAFARLIVHRLRGTVRPVRRTSTQTADPAHAIGRGVLGPAPDLPDAHHRTGPTG